MAHLIDTQALVWIGTGSRRISPAARDAISDPDTSCFVSVVTACEFADLNARGRFGADLRLPEALQLIEAEILSFPKEAWPLMRGLVQLHRDPVDRMLIAHAMHVDLAIVTADETIRRYPVRTLW